MRHSCDMIVGTDASRLPSSGHSQILPGQACQGRIHVPYGAMVEEQSHEGAARDMVRRGMPAPRARSDALDISKYGVE